jgi:transcriptional regulator with XRE-family HTH domain
MAKRDQIWGSLQDEEYRREFGTDVAPSLAFQIRLIREKYGWTQEELAHRLGKRQESISQWENPDYGRYTLSTLKDMAKAFDVALIVRFAPYSELVDWKVNMQTQSLAVPSYTEEKLQSAQATQGATTVVVPVEVLVSPHTSPIGSVESVGILGRLARRFWPADSSGTVNPNVREEVTPTAAWGIL